MDKIVESLINIEKTASELLENAYAAQRQLPQRIQEEITRRVNQVNTETQKIIDRQYQEAAAETETKIQEIAVGSQQAAEQVKAAFEQNRAAWRAELAQRVICDSNSKR